MFQRVCGEIIAVLLLATILILRLVFFLCNENQAAEIDLSDIEAIYSEHLPVQPKLLGKESEREITEAASTG